MLRQGVHEAGIRVLFVSTESLLCALSCIQRRIKKGGKKEKRDNVRSRNAGKLRNGEVMEKV